MRKKDFKTLKSYMILMDYDYTNVFIENEIDSQDQITVLIPNKSKHVPEEKINALQGVLGEKLIFIDPKEESIAYWIDVLKPDVLMTMGWRKIISPKVFSSVQLSINIHPALLPEYKGYHPLPYLIMNNEREHGMTAHLISEEVDAGDIIAQHRFKLNKFSTVRSLIDMACNEMPIFFMNVITLVDNDTYVLKKQDVKQTKVVAKRRVPSDSEVNASKPLIELYDHIRACDQERFPAYFYVNGEKVFIKLERETTDKENRYDI